MAAKSQTFSLLLCSVLCIAMLLSSRVAAQAAEAPGLIPFSAERPSSQQVQRCWLSIADIRGCVLEIYTAIISGHVKAISPACCKGIAEMKSDCHQKVFASIPFFPTLLNSTCAQSGGGGIAILTDRKDLGMDVIHCLSTINKVPGCLLAIMRSAAAGKFKYVTSDCCKAITQLTDNCWYRILPFNPFFPPLIYKYCGGQVSLPLAMLTFQGPGLLPPGPVQCWSSLASIQGCVLEIYGALSSGQFGSIGPSCCNAIRGINSNCWPLMFPMNPLFPPLLTSSCSGGGGALAPPSFPLK